MLLAADGVVLANSHQRLLARRNAGVALARLGVGLELYAEVVVELEEVGKSLWGVRIACSVSASSLRPLRFPVACGTRRHVRVWVQVRARSRWRAWVLTEDGRDEGDVNLGLLGSAYAGV